MKVWPWWELHISRLCLRLGAASDDVGSTPWPMITPCHDIRPPAMAVITALLGAWAGITVQIGSRWEFFPLPCLCERRTLLGPPAGAVVAC